jgi:CheY-like chemotaxis protein
MIPQPMLVLLVEDSPDDAALVRELLAKEAPQLVSLEWAKDLRSALERLASGSVDAILSDLSLPDSQGLDTFAKMSAAAPTVPIVILTGTYEEEDVALKAVRQGAQDYLVKGRVDGKLLLRVVRYAIERKQVQAELQRANVELKMKLDQVAWLNQIMMDREQRIIELKQENQRLLEQLRSEMLPLRTTPRTTPRTPA